MNDAVERDNIPTLFFLNSTASHQDRLYPRVDLINMTLRIGRISYLNVVPYFHYLVDEGFDGEIVSGVPSELNTLLSQGRIDACPSSSFEYGLNADQYLLLPEHSISSIGPVHSVLLFSRGPISLLDGQDIAITGESATSINLLKILLLEFCGVNDARCQVPQGRVEEALAAGQSALLIGDRALTAAQNCPQDVQITDLGALWYHFTGLPFVFALWLLRRDAVSKHFDEIARFTPQLKSARQRAFADLPALAAHYAENSGFSPAGLENYWQGIDYDLSDVHLEGLRLFFTLCEKHQLLDTVPDFHFFSAEASRQSA